MARSNVSESQRRNALCYCAYARRAPLLTMHRADSGQKEFVRLGARKFDARRALEARYVIFRTLAAPAPTRLFPR